MNACIYLNTRQSWLLLIQMDQAVLILRSIERAREWHAKVIESTKGLAMTVLLYKKLPRTQTRAKKKLQKKVSTYETRTLTK